MSTSRRLIWGPLLGCRCGFCISNTNPHNSGDSGHYHTVSCQPDSVGPPSISGWLCKMRSKWKTMRGLNSNTGWPFNRILLTWCEWVVEVLTMPKVNNWNALSINDYPQLTHLLNISLSWTEQTENIISPSSAAVERNWNNNRYVRRI